MIKAGEFSILPNMVALRFSRCRALIVAIATFGACKFPPLPEIDQDAAPGDAVDAADGPDELDASIDGASCSQTTCMDGVLEVCGASGTIESTETCRLGCFSSSRCHRVDPSNGLGSQVDASGGLGAISLAAASTIDTDTGVVRSGGGQVIAVATETVTQSGGPTIRVFMASRFTIDAIQVRGSLPVAFVAMDDLVVQGTIDASADVGVAGPGAIDCTGNGRGGHPAPGAWATARAGHVSEQYVWMSGGGGGGGFGANGAAGGAGGNGSTLLGGSGGLANGTAALVPLRGGCAGGGLNSGSVDVGNGGRAGGAVQLVSGKGEIVVRGLTPDVGGVHVGGSGGRGCANVGSSTGSPTAGTGCGPGGGGSGGAILIEAASVRFEPGAALLAAGGGGGGSGGCVALHGQDAPPGGATASGGACPAESWGTPAAGGAGATSGAAQNGATASYWVGGSGGGGLGRLRINTRDGTYSGAGSLVSRGALTTGTVTTR